ncbi:MAG: site-specific DNA-methyltransferase [Oscillospiraceae bacterium]
MIYIDPPYNTGKDFVYKDDYRDNLSNYIEMTNTTNAVNSEASGRYHTNWLNMMYPRLKLARNLLSDDGVIFISIDDNEVSNLKSICDEIFGEDNFIADIVWKHTQQSKNDERHFSRQYNHTLCYCKQRAIVSDFLFNRSEEDNKNYSNSDNDPKGDWRSGDVRSPNFRSTLKYNIVAPNGDIIVSPDNGWRWSEESIQKKISTGEIIFKKDFTGIIRKIYLCEQDGRTPENLWIGEKFGTTRQATAIIKELFNGVQVFDTPKPMELVIRMMELLNDNNLIVLDFFSGSATTAHAVMQLNAEDGGNRKYICVQLPEQTPESSEARKAGFNTIPEIAKERIRRAGKKILKEQKAKNDGLFAEDAPKLDVGFKVFKLDRSNVKEWDVEFDGLTETQVGQQLKTEFEKAMNILKDGRTELDLLYEVMLKLGLQLSTTVEAKQIDGKTVFVVGHGVMIASFAKGLTSAQIGKMVDLKADFIQASEFKVVLSDESFASDNDKTNAMQLFKQRGITNYEII